jgi:hypothetical protein
MKILCINITEDTESWHLSQQEFARVGLIVERLPATVEDNRPLAFNKSVYKAMEAARVQTDCGYAYDDLLLFEDDVVFDSAFWPCWANYPFQLPPDFLTLHLGCNLIGMDTTVWQTPTPYSEHLARLWNCWQSHATLYSAECVKYILDNFNPNVLDADNMIFDEWLRTKVLPMGCSYVMKPMIAYQRPRKSEIWNCHADYTSVHKLGNQYLSTL